DRVVSFHPIATAFRSPACCVCVNVTVTVDSDCCGAVHATCTAVADAASSLLLGTSESCSPHAPSHGSESTKTAAPRTAARTNGALLAEGILVMHALLGLGDNASAVPRFGSALGSPG